MMTSHRSLHSTCPWLLAAIAVLVIAGIPSRPVRAADRPVPSLDLVPDDAAFYSASLRGREQWQAVAKSRAWAKIKAMPLVQMGWGLYAMQAADPDSIPGKIEAALKDPVMQKRLELLAEMFSEETFVYGGSSAVQSLELVQQLLGSMRYGPIVAELNGQAKKVGPDRIRMMILLSALAKNTSLIKVPDVILGYKIKDLALARQELDRLQKDASAALAEQPKIQERLKRAMIGGNSYLTLSLDGRMVSWEEGPLEEIRKLETHKGDVDKLLARLKESTLVVAVGLRGDYLLISIGSSTDSLARLGQGKSLRSRPELAPLARFADKRLLSVGYFGKPMVARIANSKRDIDELAKTVGDLVSSIPVPPQGREEIRKDIAELVKDIKPLIPEAGAISAISFLSDGGIEGYAYDWSEHPELDGSKPLPLLGHVGGNPILAVVNRTKVSVAHYDLLSKWVLIGYRYFDKYAGAKMPADERKKFDKMISQSRPLLRRLDEANRRMLLPALADGQMGFAIDTKLTSKRFIETLPATEKPMPMIEPALLLGVSDAALLEKAFHEYWAIGNGLIDVVRGIEGTKVPADFKIPSPKTIKTPRGTIYAYALPKSWGVDPKILPNAGLSRDVVALSLSREHTQRLLNVTPPKVGGRSLPTDRPLAGVSALDFAGLIDAMTPWVDLAIDKVAQSRDSEPTNVESIRKQIHTVLDVLKVFRGMVAESYAEGKALVMHSRTEIRDVE